MIGSYYVEYMSGGSQLTIAQARSSEADRLLRVVALHQDPIHDAVIALPEMRILDLSVECRRYVGYKMEVLVKEKQNKLLWIPKILARHISARFWCNIELRGVTTAQWTTTRLRIHQTDRGHLRARGHRASTV